VLAGFVGTSISAPVEHGKIRMQLQIYGNQYAGSMDVLKKIYKSHGLKGVYQGFTVTLFRELIPTGFYYLSYEWAKRHIKTHGKVEVH
jgi:solute carrier family 25 carnitine/acylcarnitine transporter 20/29